jgi:Flp pilus assembly pilin Flp
MQRKGQQILEYALLIGVIVGALLYMQNYVKRSIQGQLQASGDQLASASARPFSKEGAMYAASLTITDEETQASSDSFELTTAGIGHPWTFTWTKVKLDGFSDRQLRPLTERWP